LKSEEHFQKEIVFGINYQSSDAQCISANKDSGLNWKSSP